MNDRLRRVRTEANLTQDEFARRLAIGRSSVSLIESGKNNPSPQTQRLICQEFGINPEWLLSGEGDMHIKTDNSVEGLAAELVIALRGNEFAISLYREAARRFTLEDWHRLRECLEAAIDNIKKTE